MPSGQRYSSKEIIDALVESRGLISVAARALGCQRQTISARMAKNPEIAETVRDQRELFVDLAESKLMDSVNESCAWAVTFTLRTLGKKRGYGGDFEMMVNDNRAQTLNAQVNLADPARLAELIAALADAKLIPSDVVSMLTALSNGRKGDQIT